MTAGTRKGSRSPAVMRVEHVMTKSVRCCAPEDHLGAAARLLWNGDCGVLPVVTGAERRVVGMLTDRDICMAAWTQAKPLCDIPVEVAMADHVYTCRPEEGLPEVLERLRTRHVRRLPVVDEGGQLLGIVSLVDVARAAELPGAPCAAAEVCSTLVAISAPPPDAA